MALEFCVSGFQHFSVQAALAEFERALRDGGSLASTLDWQSEGKIRPLRCLERYVLALLRR